MAVSSVGFQHYLLMDIIEVNALHYCFDVLINARTVATISQSLTSALKQVTTTYHRATFVSSLLAFAIKAYHDTFNPATKRLCKRGCHLLFLPLSPLLSPCRPPSLSQRCPPLCVVVVLVVFGGSSSSSSLPSPRPAGTEGPSWASVVQ